MARSREGDGLIFLQLLLILPIMSLWIWKDVPYYAEQLLSLTSQREEVKMTEFISSVWPCSVSELLLVKDLGLSHNQSQPAAQLATDYTLRCQCVSSSQMLRPISGHHHLATDWLEACRELEGERRGITNLFRASNASNDRVSELVFDFLRIQMMERVIYFSFLI